MTNVEYDLLGVVGVRLVDADDADVAAVDRQLGPIRTTLARAPDITVRFVDHVRDDEMRFVEANESARVDGDFLVLRGKHKTPARVILPLDRIGDDGAEIVVRRGAPAVPFLIACVNLVALGHGALPLHASAFIDRGLGVLVTGWSKGGKTESLLAFVNRGAEYIGDEWVYVLPDSNQMLGLPEPIRVWDWQLDQLPGMRGRVPPRDRLRMRGVRTALALGGGTPLVRRQRWLELLERQRCADVEPETLFATTPRRTPARIDRVCFVGSHTSAEVTVAPVPGKEVAARMAGSLRYEQMPLWTLYQEYRYAFPSRRNELLERAPHLQRDLLERVLVNRRCIAVEHPYPVKLDELHAAMRRGIDAGW